ncbi:hypothetical protein BSKO_13097 [Bryopsis sp. KO-2023]|nr:hypothetical protein BSKO_13097 [Bryopsis sp. KO-2023]
MGFFLHNLGAGRKRVTEMMITRMRKLKHIRRCRERRKTREEEWWASLDWMEGLVLAPMEFDPSPLDWDEMDWEHSS